MNIEALNKELTEKAQQGAVKPSDFKQKSIPTPPPLPEEKKSKKSSENGSKKYATTSAIVNYRVENIEDAIKDLDKDLAIFGSKVFERLEKVEKDLKTPLWKAILHAIQILAGVISAIAAVYCAYKAWK